MLVATSLSRGLCIHITNISCEISMLIKTSLSGGTQYEWQWSVKISMLVLTSLSGRSSLTVVVECQNKYVSLDILVWKIIFNCSGGVSK